MLSKWQFGVKILDNGQSAILSRCSFETAAGAVTCDDYEVDYIAKDKWVGIKKYYYFSGQFDVQLFADLKFIESNGRGDIAAGSCKLVRP